MDQELLMRGHAQGGDDRFFYASTPDGRQIGWCFVVRGGRRYGPFTSRDMARDTLTALIAHYRFVGDRGGR